MKNEHGFFERILQIAEYHGYKNGNDFARNGLGYASSEKINRLRDKNNKPSVDILLDIANKFDDINLHWLITGIGDKTLSHIKFARVDAVPDANTQNNAILNLQNKLILEMERSRLLEEQLRIMEQALKTTAGQQPSTLEELGNIINELQTLYNNRTGKT
jgi:hypothetical protein